MKNPINSSEHDHSGARSELSIVSADEYKSPYFLFVNECMREKFDALFFSNPTDRSSKQRQVIDAMEPVIYDLEFLLNVLKKIEWMTGLYRENTLAEADWSAFVQTDIHAFHVEFRSLLDTVAAAVSALAVKRDQVPTSFHDLIELCKKKSLKMQGLLGIDVVQLLCSICWFDSLRDSRDFIVHKRRDALVRLDESGNHILFRTMFASRPDTYAGIPEFGFDDDWILFQPYAGYYLGRLFFFLDSYTAILCTRLLIKHITSKPYAPPAIEQAMSAIRFSNYCLTPIAAS